MHLDSSAHPALCSISPALLPSFSAAVTPLAVREAEGNFPADFIMETILELCHYLLLLSEQSPMFSTKQHDPFVPNLRTLYDRLHNGQPVPSPLQESAYYNKRAFAELSRRISVVVDERPLEDFEDLYYAAIARMLDVHHTLNARLGSGFNTLNDLVSPNGPTIKQLYEGLLEYWVLLNNPSFAKCIDVAVRGSRIQDLHQEIQGQVLKGKITQADCDELLADLYDPDEYDEIHGLQMIGKWTPSIIGAFLEDRYRILLDKERENEQKALDCNFRMAQMPTRSSPRSRKASLSIIAAPYNFDASLDVKPYQPEDIDLSAPQWSSKNDRVDYYSEYLRGQASGGIRIAVEEAFPFNTDDIYDALPAVKDRNYSSFTSAAVDWQMDAPITSGHVLFSETGMGWNVETPPMTTGHASFPEYGVNWNTDSQMTTSHVPYSDYGMDWHIEDSMENEYDSYPDSAVGYGMNLVRPSTAMSLTESEAMQWEVQLMVSSVAHRPASPNAITMTRGRNPVE